MLRQAELKVQVYLAEREDEAGADILKTIKSKEANKPIMAKYGYDTKGYEMTPQEELFAKFFNDEGLIVSQMDTLTLRAHREQLAQIAFEARARLTRADDEERQRTSKEKAAKGFAVNLQGDDKTSDAINTLKERQKRLSKADKLKSQMAQLFGGDAALADALMSNTAIAKQVNDKKQLGQELTANHSSRSIEIQPILIDKNGVWICIECDTKQVSLDEKILGKPRLIGRTKCNQCNTEFELDATGDLIKAFAEKTTAQKVETVTVEKPKFVNPFAK